MTSFESIVHLFIKHQDDIAQLALNNANTIVIRLNLQLNRVRTIEEQYRLLTIAYRRELVILRRFEDRQVHVIPFILESLPYTEMTLSQVGEATKSFRNVYHIEGLFDDIDFEEIKELPLTEIPKDHPILHLLNECIDYYTHLDFFERINQLLNRTEKENKKIPPEELESTRDEYRIRLTVAQKVLALDKMLEWADVGKLKRGQSTKRQQFIATLTNLPTASVKAKYPNQKNVERKAHLSNLEALIPLFELIGATEWVQKIEKELHYERRERE